MPLIPLDYAPKPSFDTGLFIARYLQVLSAVSIGWMVVGPFITGQFNLDLSCVFLLWIASALRRHSPLARKFVIVICVFGLLLSVELVVQAAVFGTAHMKIELFRRISNPALWQVALASSIGAIVAAIPFCVLLSSNARRQFAEPSGRREPSKVDP